MGPALFLFGVVLVFGAAAIHYAVTGPSSTERSEADEVPPSALIEPLFRSLSAATFLGVILGFVVGGIGGRLAMRLLFLTSPDGVKGLTSDDGFEIGRFDLVDTLNLLFLGAVVGVIGGMIYLAVRRWLPRGPTLRWATSAAVAAAMVGPAIVHADGIDFIVLKPLWLAVALFILIPGLFGAVIARLVDGADDPGSWFQRKRLPVAGAPLALLLFPPTLLLLAVPLGAAVVGRWRAARSPRFRDLWESDQFQWAGRIVLGLVAGLGVFALANDIRALI